MSLKVLLADESSTIKKVFQLALQDYAVEVRSVNVGLDVVEVAESFQPDIIFADVLLQKRSGYDVSADIKNSPALRETPVVIMWSGFMELDQDKFQASSANGQLEKPFDVDGLRQVIRGLVSKAKTQNLAEFLDFPNLPEFTESSPDPIEGSTEEEFAQINLPASPKTESPAESATPRDFLTDDEEESSWVQKDISKYKVDANPDLNVEDQPIAVNYIIPDEPIEASTIATTDQPKPALDSDSSVDTEELPIEESDCDLELDEEELSPPALSSGPAHLSEKQIEEVIRAQSAEVIEKIVWKVVPDLASRIIERELDRLLNEKGL
ncbi:response regulator [Bdellovibrionales bacterium]|nr:response regulator [Bdellovibrionales bacterium]